MTQTKTGASRLGGRLLKSAATSVLALSAVAGGLMLSGGEAKALTCLFGGGVITNCNYGAGGPPIVPTVDPINPANLAPPFGYYNQWYDTNKEVMGQSIYHPTDKDIYFKSGPSSGSGTIDWYWTDTNNSNTWLIPPDPHSVDMWTVDVDFIPGLAPGNPPSVFEYVVIIDKGQGGVPHLPYNDFFEDVTLTVQFEAPSPGPLSFVQKDIYQAICTSSTPGGMFDNCVKGNSIASLFVDELTPGARDYINITNLGLDKLYIVDTAHARSDVIDAYQNVYRQVPGPLPALGASLVLGSVRKLRNLTSRLKTSSMG